jgi:hypothetical protein
LLIVAARCAYSSVLRVPGACRAPGEQQHSMVVRLLPPTALCSSWEPWEQGT